MVELPTCKVEALLTQVDEQKQLLEQYPNSQIDQSPVKTDNLWDYSNEFLVDCSSEDMNSIQGQAASDSHQSKSRRRARRQWNKRGQQPAMCSQSGSTNIQPKIAPNLIKNPALPVSPTESDRFKIPVFPGSNVHRGENPTCLQKTLGWLPLGICDSGVEFDRYESIFDVYGIAASVGRQVTTGLENCVLGASFCFYYYSFIPVPTKHRKRRKERRKERKKKIRNKTEKGGRKKKKKEKKRQWLT